MDVDSGNHREKGIPFSGMDAHIMEMVIIQNLVIGSLTGSVVVVNLLIFIGSSGNRGVESDIPFWFGIDVAFAGRRGAFLFTGTEIIFTAGQRAAPFMGMLLFTSLQWQTLCPAYWEVFYLSPVFKGLFVFVRREPGVWPIRAARRESALSFLIQVVRLAEPSMSIRINERMLCVSMVVGARIAFYCVVLGQRCYLIVSLKRFVESNSGFRKMCM